MRQCLDEAQPIAAGSVWVKGQEVWFLRTLIQNLNKHLVGGAMDPHLEFAVAVHHGVGHEFARQQLSPVDEIFGQAFTRAGNQSSGATSLRA